MTLITRPSLRSGSGSLGGSHPVALPELGNPADALNHLALGFQVVDLAEMVQLRHHDDHEPPVLRHHRHPLHLRMYSFPHCPLQSWWFNKTNPN